MQLFPDLPPQSAPSDPGIAGLNYVADVLTAEAERGLIEAAAAAPLAPFRFQGWTGKRRTASFGWHYDFDAAEFAEAEPIPDWATPIRASVAQLFGVAADELVQLLVTRYDPNAGIGWHRDRPVFDRVIGVSLGAPATLRLRRRRPGGFDRRAIALAPRSAYLLSGEARQAWEHSIAPITETRWSLTFRTLSASGRAIERRGSRPSPRAGGGNAPLIG